MTDFNDWLLEYADPHEPPILAGIYDQLATAYAEYDRIMEERCGERTPRHDSLDGYITGLDALLTWRE